MERSRSYCLGLGAHDPCCGSDFGFGIGCAQVLDKLSFRPHL